MCVLHRVAYHAGFEAATVGDVVWLDVALTQGFSVASLDKCPPLPEREFFVDNLLVRIHFIIVMIRWTGLAPLEFEFSFPGSLTSTFLVPSQPSTLNHTP